MIESSWIGIDKLTPNARNARTHSRKQICQIGRPGQFSMTSNPSSNGKNHASQPGLSGGTGLSPVFAPQELLDDDTEDPE
jgi:hypothetical protein